MNGFTTSPIVIPIPVTICLAAWLTAGEPR
jgi:hypothetical protein